jgi:single-stranded-DNA-specific exonuclease
MRWIDAPTSTAPSPLLRLHPLVGQALFRRGITTREAARAFLDPQEYSPSPPSELPGLSAAVERIEQAIRLKQPVLVWGDFDVDGQTATTILVQTLQELGALTSFHIPVRSRESHGLNVEFLEEPISQGIKLVITCDTGISSHLAVEYARRRGVDTVITDHHDLPAKLPAAAAIINPKLLPAEHPLVNLPGAGVAYKLAEELLQRQAGRLTLPASDLLDITSLGIVADLAILRGDTRYLVQRGLKALRETKRSGLQVMFELAEIEAANLTEEHISFALAPRLNALGRLGDAQPVVELLTSSDPSRTRLLATQLENYNAQRQLLTNQVVQAAEAQLQADPSLLAQPVIVLSHPSWPGGITGIAAARLVDRYHKPAILLSTPPNEPARGSARSVEGLNITTAIASQADLLYNFGGHPMAAGLAMDLENLPEFRTRLARIVEASLAANATEERGLEIDSWLDLPEISLDLALGLEKLAPYGPGNSKLTLASRNLELRSSSPIGRNKEHLKLIVADAVGNTQELLWWNGNGEVLPDNRFDLAYTLRAADYRGTRQVQMEFVDFRLREPETVPVVRKKPQVIDLRQMDPVEALKQLPEGTLLWMEGEEKNRLNGRDRNALIPARGLAIWTSPPSVDAFMKALEIVSPQVVYLIAANPILETVENFMARLTGLLKYTLRHRQGQVSYLELAAATGQPVLTVKRGLAWLIARGKIILQREENGVLWLSAGSTAQPPAGANRLWAEIQSLLAETAAYRTYFKRAEIDRLIP